MYAIDRSTTTHSLLLALCLGLSLAACSEDAGTACDGDDCLFVVDAQIVRLETRLSEAEIAELGQFLGNIHVYIHS